MEQDEVYNLLNNQWKTTCRILFGLEVGDLDEYKEWLTKLNNPKLARKSSISGIDTVFTNNEFSENAKFISMDEVGFNKKFEPLDINEIKDVDSILQALQERFYYCGNIVLGNSKFVEKSSNVNDSFFVYDSVKISDCKNIAYSQYLRLCENIFGTNEGGESKFCIRCSILFKNMRCFELWKSTSCSDCYYSFGLDSCRDTFFSFNLVGKQYAIGNRTLPKDKFFEIKKKLLSEIVEKLKKDKKLPSLVEVVGKTTEHSEALKLVEIMAKDDVTSDKSVIEDLFSKTSSVLFGRSLEGGIDTYDKWLRNHIVIPYPLKSVLSKKQIQMSDWPGLSQLPKEKLVTYDEARNIAANIKISERQAENLTLDNAFDLLSSIAYYSPEQSTGRNLNLIDCQWGSDASNCYKSVICVYSKNCAYCSWPRSSENCFGCGIAFDCDSSMKCYDSVKLTRCLEVDGGRNSHDAYFCHNIEGLRNALFCFNVKSLRHAIGNLEVGKETYEKVKKLVINEILDELESKKSLKWDIFNLMESSIKRER